MSALVKFSQLLVLVVMLSVCGAQKTVSLKENADLVLNKWRCKDPQPRLVYLTAEVEGFDANTMYFPPAVVLNRCDKSVGCCTRSGYSCGPAETEDVTVTFKAVSVGKRQSNEDFKFVNHTKCECLPSDFDAPR